MKLPTWIKPAILGAIVGSIATMVIGFSQAGWMLGSTAERMAEKQAAVAATDALVPFCVSRSEADPSSATKLAELDALVSSYARRDFVIESGWATLPTADKPNRDLAAACAKALTSSSEGA
ncbi:MAG: hypothetical protein AB7J30_20220 [Hyphomicrobium sp.]|uniref:hypothetical protein n=1 Tax=Hyphomicrobium sp. TaxID=82 RepID=UPI003D13F107